MKKTAVAPDDWNYKMCKKIAQLTKVIYTLNCKTEDNEERLQWYLRQHKEELAKVCREYESQLESYLEKLKQKDGEKQTALSEVENKHSTLLREAEEGFRTKVTALTTQVEEAKRHYTDAIKDFSDGQVASLKKEMEDLKRSKNEEMEGLVKEYNERYKSMLAQQMDAADEREKELNETWGAKVKALEEEIALMKKNASAELDDKSRSVQDLMTQNAKLAKANETLDNENTELKGKIAQAESDKQNNGKTSFFGAEKYLVRPKTRKNSYTPV
ncbi:hypothetical protein AGDE_12979 [Angomonas deanei]|uniref:Family with sequence similarity 184, A and B, putative n=1 Tax=Angomonas deanei TaxID=59799 RepID=A0A7G2CC87_9TRYP|nr:hypothetical protein AGDE_12979 [Angomonas deanei]CAD2216534.1 Family with sequence similarity 184, A and B, putative [Angomonas deanei]|eukprot:EPY23140.1 hypothetical protein AGDE_12979 [Angomonas deanei]